MMRTSAHSDSENEVDNSSRVPLNCLSGCDLNNAPSKSVLVTMPIGSRPFVGSLPSSGSTGICPHPSVAMSSWTRMIVSDGRTVTEPARIMRLTG